MFNYLDDGLFETKLKNKKTVKRLLDKYGTLDNFKQNSTLMEDFEYQFAQGDDVVDELERERQAMMRAMNNLPKQQGTSLDDGDMNVNASVYRVRNSLLQTTNDGNLLSSSLSPVENNSLLKQYANNQLTPTMSDARVGYIDYSKYGEGFSRKFIDKMTNDFDFQKALNRTQLNEGGYNNDKDDRGGETNMGITKRYYPNEDIKNLTRERANAILYRDYWLKYKINTLPVEISDIVFDNAVVQGQGTAIKNLQRALNVRDDGIIGQETIDALKGANYQEIKKLFSINANAIEDIYQRNDLSQKKYEKGHRNRYNRYLE